MCCTDIFHNPETVELSTRHVLEDVSQDQTLVRRDAYVIVKKCDNNCYVYARGHS